MAFSVQRASVSKELTGNHKNRTRKLKAAGWRLGHWGFGLVWYLAAVFKVVWRSLVSLWDTNADTENQWHVGQLYNNHISSSGVSTVPSSYSLTKVFFHWKSYHQMTKAAVSCWQLGLSALGKTTLVCPFSRVPSFIAKHSKSNWLACLGFYKACISL